MPSSCHKYPKRAPVPGRWAFGQDLYLHSLSFGTSAASERGKNESSISKVDLKRSRLPSADEGGKLSNTVKKDWAFRPLYDRSLASVHRGRRKTNYK